MARRLAPPSSGRGGRGRLDATQLVSLGLLVVGVVLLLDELGLPIDSDLAWPAALVTAGAAAIWRQLDDEQEARLRLLAERIPGRPLETMVASPGAWVRIGAGALLVLAGVGGFLAASDALPALRQGLIATAALVLGLALVFGPWWWRLGRDLAEERRRRIRSEERAELAAHLHDSVLQTLALIQRTADDPAQVTRLARRQERALRSWLFGAPAAGATTLAAALHGVVEEVETDFDVTVELVVVGDAPLDPRAEALVAATREAVVNAARHAAVDALSVYVEAEPGRLTAAVRDRGRGFDPAAVASDRRGIAESIEGRLDRHGGRAVIRSAPGEGTEIEMEVPRRGS